MINCSLSSVAMFLKILSIVDCVVSVFLDNAECSH